MALAALLAAVVVLSIAGQAQHAPGQVTVLSPESYPLAGGTQPILDLAASALLPGYAFAQSVALDLTAAGSINNNSTLLLYGPWSITTFTSDGATYAAVAAFEDDGVQILDVTDPFAVTAAGNIANNSTLLLDGASDIAIFESGGGTYAAVTAALDDDGVQILDVTDPYCHHRRRQHRRRHNPRAGRRMGHRHIRHQATAPTRRSPHTGDDGVQILDVTDPYCHHRRRQHYGDSSGNLELGGARDIAIFTSGGGTYAAVAAYADDGVQILDVTDPSSHHRRRQASMPTPTTSSWTPHRTSPYSTSGGGTYAAVAASANDDGVQILNVTDPYRHHRRRQHRQQQ